MFRGVDEYLSSFLLNPNWFHFGNAQQTIGQGAIPVVYGVLQYKISAYERTESSARQPG
jgi:hypothetical protein